MSSGTFYRFACALDRVVDGDTLDLLVDLGFSVSVRIRVRLLGVDTPEVYGVRHDSPEYLEGLRASVFVEDWLGRRELVVETLKNPGDKYGRWLATVRDANTGESLNDTLAGKGWATDAS